MDPTALRFEATAKIVTVFYHGGCQDGITGAWGIFRALPMKYQNELRALGGLFGEGGAPPPPEKQLAIGPLFVGIQPSGEKAPTATSVKDRHVIYVDVTPDEATVRLVHDQARTVNFIDHHRSQKPVLDVARALPRAQVDYSEAHSGAQIAWTWAHEILIPTSPHAQFPCKAPAIVNYVGDRDLWDYRQYRSREVCKALLVDNMTRGFDTITALAASGSQEAHWDGIADRGSAYLLYEEQAVKRIAANACVAVVQVLFPSESVPREYQALVVNTSIFQSEVGDSLMIKAEPEIQFAMAWYFNAEKNETWVSIRTNRPDVDLSIISKHIVGSRSGGGHPRAAGCAVEGNAIEKIAVFVRKALQ